MDQNYVHGSTDTLSPAFWTNVMSNSICAMDFHLGARSAHGGMTLDAVRVGSLVVSRYQSTGANGANRRLEHIKKDCLDGFILTLPICAAYRFFQNGRECIVLPGSFALIKTARPFLIKEQPGILPTGLTSFHVTIPASLLRSRCAYIDDLCNRALPILRGAGKMLQSLVASTVQHGASLQDGAAQNVSTLLVELIASAATQDTANAQSVRLPAERVRELTLRKAANFIADNLSDPNLSTVLVAEHCNVSVRYLQALFESASMSVAANIRNQRLLRCRDSLRSPNMNGRTIAEIAALWGFPELSHFSRAYKARFGIAPKEERLCQLMTPPASSGG